VIVDDSGRMFIYRRVQPGGLRETTAFVACRLNAAIQTQGIDLVSGHPEPIRA
jgi:hypothetical protein